jgi:hypothetical protein
MAVAVWRGTAYLYIYTRGRRGGVVVKRYSDHQVGGFASICWLINCIIASWLNMWVLLGSIK